MFAVMRQLPAGVLAALVMTTSACASQSPIYRSPAGAPGIDRRAYTIGYDEGRQRGEQDARRQRSFDPSRHDAYRNVDSRNRGYGSQTRYAGAFRQGFMAGYNEGYRLSARTGGRAYDGYASPAADIGYRDGYQQGREDARDGNRFDPIRSLRYRAGDHDYNRRYGSLDEYKRDYRAAFQAGYDAGYRGGRR
jgi:hypothetical protein